MRVKLRNRTKHLLTRIFFFLSFFFNPHFKVLYPKRLDQSTLLQRGSTHIFLEMQFNFYFCVSTYTDFLHIQNYLILLVLLNFKKLFVHIKSFTDKCWTLSVKWNRNTISKLVSANINCKNPRESRTRETPLGIRSHTQYIPPWRPKQFHGSPVLN